LKAVFLGTGTSTGVPMICCDCEVCRSSDPRDQRTRTSFYIESEQTRIVFDTGPDFRMQMLSNRLTDLDAVVFTHNHKDHTAGLDDVRPINHLRKKVVQVYAEPKVQESLRREYAYIFLEKDYPGIPQIGMNTIGVDPFSVGDVDLIPIRVWHMNMPVLGFRVGNLTYITDANRIEETEFEKIKGSKILILNALHHTTHYSHFSLTEALAIVERVQPEQAYFTHISHHLGLHALVEKSLPKHVHLAFDGLALDF
jgi:phosphoribosyl 1,2-cyclic phosphate phosphodiesterase